MIRKYRRHFTTPFYYILVSHFVSNMADRGIFIFLCWAIVKSQGSLALNVFICLSLLLHLLLVRQSSKQINRYGPVKIFIGSDLLKLISCLVFALVFWIWPNLNIYGLIILGFITNIGSAFFNPSAMTMPSFLTEDATKRRYMTSLLSTSLSLSTILGPLLAALFLMAPANFTAVIFFMVGLMYLVPILNNYRFLGLTYTRGTFTTNKLDTIPKVMKSYPDIAWLLLCFLLINLAFVPIQYFIPLRVKADFINYGGHAVALFEGLIGAGAFIGALSLALIKKNIDNVFIIFTAFFATGIFYAGFNITQNLIATSLSLFLMGIALSVGNILAITYYQTKTTHNYVAIIMGLVNLISVAVGPIAIFLSGLSVKFVGLNTSLTLYSSAMGVFSIGLLLTSFFKKRRPECTASNVSC